MSAKPYEPPVGRAVGCLAESSELTTITCDFSEMLFAGHSFVFACLRGDATDGNFSRSLRSRRLFMVGQRALERSSLRDSRSAARTDLPQNANVWRLSIGSAPKLADKRRTKAARDRLARCPARA